MNGCSAAVPGAGENASEKKQQRSDAKCQPCAVAPSPSQCADRWEPLGSESWGRQQCGFVPRWGTCTIRKWKNWSEDDWYLHLMVSDPILFNPTTKNRVLKLEQNDIFLGAKDKAKLYLGYFCCLMSVTVVWKLLDPQCMCVLPHSRRSNQI